MRAIIKTFTPLYKMKCDKDIRQRCEDYSSGTRMPPNHHVRSTEKCIYENDGECHYAPSCNLGKVRRIKKGLKK